MVKIPLIMYIFSAGLMFGGYYVNEASGLNLFAGSTYDSIQELIQPQQEIDETITLDLIFGDFLKGATVFFGIVTGSSIANALEQLPHFDEMWGLLAQILFTTTSAFMWVYIIAGRVM